MSQNINIGIIGAGVISTVYLRNLTTRWDHVRVVAIADIVPEAAQRQADAFGILALPVDDLITHPDVDIVLNLTIPAAHAEVALLAISNGKSVYSEKPLALTREDGQAILDAAREKGVLVGCAPDTFMGAGIETARRLIVDGAIGDPVAFAARMVTHGPESWHPNPAFFYQPGAGPMLDMGPYYVTALVALLGEVESITGTATTTFQQRTITSETRHGEVIDVHTPTHIQSTLTMRSGVVGTLLTTFDLYDPEHYAFTIWGTEGSLRLPDPNTFGGPLRIFRPGDIDWSDVPLDTDLSSDDSRGLGVQDMARALLDGSADHRANGDQAYHVLDVMLSALEA